MLIDFNAYFFLKLYNHIIQLCVYVYIYWFTMKPL